MSIKSNKFKKISDLFNKNRISEDASLINYFIKKFANENPNDLSYIYDNIPKEEQQDFIDAIIKESVRIDEIHNDVDDSYLSQIHTQIGDMDEDRVMFRSPDGQSITMGDLLNTLLSEPTGT